jgi:rod shape-determining protein MreD
VRLVALFTALTFLALAIQTIAARWLPLSALVPELVLILAVDLGLKHRRALAAVMAFAMGYAMDSFSGSQLGLNTFMVTLVFLLAYEVGTHLNTSGAQAGVLLVFAGVLVQSLGGYLIGNQFHTSGQFWTLVPPALLQAFVTALIAAPVFALLERANRMFGLTRERRARGYLSRGV